VGFRFFQSRTSAAKAVPFQYLERLKPLTDRAFTAGLKRCATLKATQRQAKEHDSATQNPHSSEIAKDGHAQS